MKKILLTLALATAMVSAKATDYTDSLVVNVSTGQKVTQTTQTSTISVEKRTDGAYNFSLKDFTFGGQIKIGDINLDSVPGVEQNGVIYLATQKNVHVRLYGMPLNLPVTLRGELLNNSTKLYASMDINVTLTHQTVNVLFGNGGYQIPNSGFEDFHTETLYNPEYNDDYSDVIGWTTEVAKTAQVPNSWHSFMDATGWGTQVSEEGDSIYKNWLMVVYLASGMVDTHTYVSDETRPGSFGKHSAKLVARDAFLAIANGTMTTGRMNTGSTTATDVANHAWLDMDSTDVDANGDHFYTVMNGRPDSLSVWVKYGQGTVNAEHPYATVSAVITDGTYYQEPDTIEYNNIYAIARNNKIESTNGEWKQIKIPFEIKDANVNGKAIMVTISTNADAGQGSANDSILVDDINLVYNTPQNVQINFGGNGTISPDDITATWEGANGAIVVKDLKQDGDNVVATVTVYNGDLTKQVAQEKHTYINATTTGINNINADTNTSRVVETYDLSGRRVNNSQRGGIFIVKTADGKTIKVAK